MLIGATFRLTDDARSIGRAATSTRHQRWEQLMQCRTVGRTGVQVSSLALGAMNFGAIGRTTQHAHVWNIPGGDVDDAIRRSVLLDRRHVILILPAPYREKVARWVADELIAV